MKFLTQNNSSFNFGLWQLRDKKAKKNNSYFIEQIFEYPAVYEALIQWMEEIQN